MAELLTDYLKNSKLVVSVVVNVDVDVDVKLQLHRYFEHFNSY